jgi:hypothetical protein
MRLGRHGHELIDVEEREISGLHASLQSHPHHTGTQFLFL